MYRRQSGTKRILIPERPLSYDPKEIALLKAMADAKAEGQPYRASGTLYQLGAYTGVKETAQATASTIRILREVPRKNPVVSAAIGHRQSQVLGFARSPRWKGDTGWEIRGRDRRKQPSRVAREKIEEITRIVRDGGVWRENSRTGEPGAWNSEESRRAPGLHNALKMLVWDSLTIDAAAIHIEKGLNDKKYPISFWEPVDAGLIRYATSKEEGKNAIDAWGGSFAYRPEIRKIEEAAFVMLQQAGSGVVREYTWNELAYHVRNPRTDQWVMGYGFSEIEKLIDIIAGILYGIGYNKEYFDSNHVPPGILSLRGNYSQTTIEAFQENLKMMSGGAGQYHNIPVIASPDGQAASYVPLRDQSTSGMFWKEWILFCATIVCAVFQMDATEINMTNFGTSTNSLANTSPEAKLKHSQESGLEPLLIDFSDYIDRAIVQKLDPDFEFIWCGLDAEDPAQEQAERQSRLTMGLSTPNAERARNDEPPIYDPLDAELWQKCRDAEEKSGGEEWETLTGDDQTERIVDAYRKAGGKLATWPDAPVDCPGALQIWMQEHNMQPEPQAGAQPGQEPQKPGEEEENGKPEAQKAVEGRKEEQEDARKPAGDEFFDKKKPGIVDKMKKAMGLGESVVTVRIRRDEY